MAFLLRPTRRIHTLITPSLLHHRLSQPTALSLSLPSDHLSRSENLLPNFLLPQTQTAHYFSSAGEFFLRLRRTLNLTNSAAGEDPNSNHPSPSILRELKEAIKQLSSSLHNCDPTSSTFPSFNSEQAEPESAISISDASQLDKKLEQLKVRALSLRNKQILDQKRLWEMEKTRLAFSNEVHAELEKDRESSSGFIRLMWLKDRTLELSHMTSDMVNSRLDILYEMAEDLSKIRGDLQDDELWKELDDGLRRVQEMEFNDYGLLCQKYSGLLDSMQQNINSIAER